MQAYFDDLFNIIKNDVTVRIYDTDDTLMLVRLKSGFTSAMYNQLKLDCFELLHIGNTYVDLQIC